MELEQCLWEKPPKMNSPTKWKLLKDLSLCFLFSETCEIHYRAWVCMGFYIKRKSKKTLQCLPLDYFFRIKLVLVGDKLEDQKTKWIWGNLSYWNTPTIRTEFQCLGYLTGYEHDYILNLNLTVFNYLLPKVFIILWAYYDYGNDTGYHLPHNTLLWPTFPRIFSICTL